ncbi:hypothetical protein EBR57_02840 [bacterium]|nr:hypothetical protein [bacterium]
MRALKNAFKLSILIGLTVLSFGCARTFTSRTAVLVMKVTLTFEGPVDLNKFNYMLIFSRSKGITLPPNTAPFPYFPTPGRTFNTDYLLRNSSGLSTYYQNFYTTWSDYMIFGTNTRAVYSSGGTAFVTPTTNIDGNEVVATQNFFFSPTSGFSPSVEINGNTMTISFQIQQLAPNTTFLYMQIATIERDIDPSMIGFDAGEFRDCLAAPIGIPIQQNNDQSVPDGTNTDLSNLKGADIRSCRIQIL